jgi:hypothetical protein
MVEDGDIILSGLPDCRLKNVTSARNRNPLFWWKMLLEFAKK